MMLFEARYYADRLRIVNPSGDVGIVTLWSQVDTVHNVLGKGGIDLLPDSSRVAVMANLYGNGLPQMLRNLLWNPQVRYILILGKNLSGSREWLLSFFEHGLEEVEFLGSRAHRIESTARIIDGQVTPEQFAQKLQFSVFGDIGDGATVDGIRSFLESLPPVDACPPERVSPPAVPEPSITRFPSEARSHTIVRATPMEAWAELIFRLVRFGHGNKVAKGLVNGQPVEEDRIELQNVKVIIQQPREEPEATLAKHGFSIQEFRKYQARMLDAVKPAAIAYTYGNRLRGYFRQPMKWAHFWRGRTVVDSLEVVARHLREQPESRHAYIALWDNSRDLPEGHSCPCFVSAFFRRFEGALTLTATFRTHNALDAWPQNLYGLMAIQQYVAERVKMEAGPITVISHSIGIDLPSLERAKQVADSKVTDEVLDAVTGKYQPRFDPNGEFGVTIDPTTREIIVQHSYEGMVINEYRGNSAEQIERQLARDVALSDISHALYLGREIARKEFQMKAERRKAEQAPE